MAAEDPRTQALLAADDARLDAMIHPSREALDALLCDDLRYAHSNGVVDTKASLIDALVSGRLRYLANTPSERNFSFPAPDVATMSGTTRIHVAGPSGNTEATLLFLAVWKREGERWRFFAWQSCRLPPK
ncbi:MAG: hypothetical protein RLZZ142_133 [Verrucomicrobiota bacterium]|jgi:hypothetical protein